MTLSVQMYCSNRGNLCQSVPQLYLQNIVNWHPEFQLMVEKLANIKKRRELGTRIMNFILLNRISVAEFIF